MGAVIGEGDPIDRIEQFIDQAHKEAKELPVFIENLEPLPSGLFPDETKLKELLGEDSRSKMNTQFKYFLEPLGSTEIGEQAVIHAIGMLRYASVMTNGGSLDVPGRDEFTIADARNMVSRGIHARLLGLGEGRDSKKIVEKLFKQQP